MIMFTHLFEKCEKFNISMHFGGVNPPKTTALTSMPFSLPCESRISDL